MACSGAAYRVARAAGVVPPGARWWRRNAGREWREAEDSGPARPPAPPAGRRHHAAVAPAAFRRLAGLPAFAAAVALAAGAALAGDVPQRVVSLNVCTDQLAMMLAAPGQLVAISTLARDPRASAMAFEADAYPVTHGAAEEVFRLAPDLVLAGTYTAHHTTAMLRRLGVEVVEFAPTRTLAGIRDDILRMGRALAREAEAAAMLAAFDAQLKTLHNAPARRPRAAFYSANGWSSGPQTLAGEILEAAGFSNVAVEAGIDQGGFLPLEQLVMLDPDIIITGEPYPGHSRSEAMLQHPALVALRAGRPEAALSEADWVCGTPHVLRAIAGLRDAREALE